MGPDTYKVFVSSTYLDNKDRRKRIERVILQAQMAPIGMERFTADTEPTVDECLRMAREASVFVGILAWRYGWIPEGYKRSITELEYEAAEAVPEKRLMFIVDEDQARKVADEDPGEERFKKGKMLVAFKKRVESEGGMPGTFRDENLETKVLAALLKWKKKAEESQRPGAKHRPLLNRDEYEGLWRAWNEGLDAEPKLPLPDVLAERLVQSRDLAEEHRQMLREAGSLGKKRYEGGVDADQLPAEVLLEKLISELHSYDDCIRETLDALRGVSVAFNDWEDPYGEKDERFAELEGAVRALVESNSKMKTWIKDDSGPKTEKAKDHRNRQKRALGAWGIIDQLQRERPQAGGD